jgi:hypothetical protein
MGLFLFFFLKVSLKFVYQNRLYGRILVIVVVVVTFFVLPTLIIFGSISGVIERNQ